MKEESKTKNAPRGERVSILVVDDHPIVRQGMRHLLEQVPEFSVAAEAGDAREALEAIRAQRPDVVILDISLKGMDGLELTKAIRAQYETLPVLIMSMHDESLYAERVLRAGGNGYIMKHEVADNVIQAVRQVLRGQIYVSENIRQRILQGLGTSRPDLAASPVERLSDRELEVFQLIGRGLGTRRIAEELHLSVKTIETYRAHIKEKLGLETAAELVRRAVQWVETEGST